MTEESKVLTSKIFAGIDTLKILGHKLYRKTSTKLARHEFINGITTNDIFIRKIHILLDESQLIGEELPGDEVRSYIEQYSRTTYPEWNVMSLSEFTDIANYSPLSPYKYVSINEIDNPTAMLTKYAYEASAEYRRRRDPYSVNRIKLSGKGFLFIDNIHTTIKSTGCIITKEYIHRYMDICASRLDLAKIIDKHRPASEYAYIKDNWIPTYDYCIAIEQLSDCVHNRYSLQRVVKRIHVRNK